MKTYILKRPSKAVRRIFDLWADDLVRGSLVTHQDCTDAVTMFRAIARIRAKTFVMFEANYVWLRGHFAEQLQLCGPFEPELRKEVLPVLAWLDSAKQVG